MPEGAVIDTAIGAPQGAVISPLPSNIYVHPLDLCWEREVRGTKDGEVRRRSRGVMQVEAGEDYKDAHRARRRGAKSDPARRTTRY